MTVVADSVRDLFELEDGSIDDVVRTVEAVEVELVRAHGREYDLEARIAEAADRIEELEAELKECTSRCDRMMEWPEGEQP